MGWDITILRIESLRQNAYVEATNLFYPLVKDHSLPNPKEEICYELYVLLCFFFLSLSFRMGRIP